MSRKPKPRPPAKPVILPPELDDDEEITGGGVPDDDGMVYLRRSVKGGKRDKARKKEKPA